MPISKRTIGKKHRGGDKGTKREDRIGERRTKKKKLLTLPFKRKLRPSVFFSNGGGTLNTESYVETVM